MKNLTIGYMKDGIRVVPIIKLMEHLFGDNYFKDCLFLKMSYKEQSRAIRQWVDENNAHYYSDVKERFFDYIGVQQTKDLSKKVVVVENLS